MFYVNYPEEWYYAIKHNNYKQLKKSMREYYGTFPIPKTITRVKFDWEQYYVTSAIKHNAVIKTYIKPLQFFEFETTKGLDLKWWLDINALVEKLDQLKKGVMLDTPVVGWDVVKNKNVSHEGRHRCLAYDIAGVRKLAILVVFWHRGLYGNVKNVDGRILRRFKPFEIYRRGF